MSTIHSLDSGCSDSPPVPTSVTTRQYPKKRLFSTPSKHTFPSSGSSVKGERKGTHLVLYKQGALWRVWEMGCCSLDHQLKGGARSHIPEILLPHNGARAAFNTKKLSRDTGKPKFRTTHLWHSSTASFFRL